MIQVKVNKPNGMGLIVKFDAFHIQAIPTAYGSAAYKSRNFTHKRGTVYKRLELQYK